jgi:hypothetical protein
MIRLTNWLESPGRLGSVHRLAVFPFGAIAVVTEVAPRVRFIVLKMSDLPVTSCGVRPDAPVAFTAAQYPFSGHF